MSGPIELPVPFERASRVRRGIPPHLVGAGFAAALLVALAFITPNLGAFLVSTDLPMPSQVTFLTYGVSIRRGALDAAVARVRSGETRALVLGALNSRDAEYYVTPHSAELARRYLIDAGIGPELITTLPSVSSEWEEGEALRVAVVRERWTSIVAYAPDFRSRRSRGVLRRLLNGTGSDLRVVSVPDVEVRLDRWWETRPGINVIYNEYPRLAYYWLLGRLG
ncbi:MAG: hypothetical protein EXR45_00720 [Chloroflexi bacterium]|nr:hypothetical protein [Chloroflexota bacterium]